MAVTASQIAAYRIHFYGRSRAAGDQEKKAEIFLIGMDNPQLGPCVGRLLFYSPDVADTKQDNLDSDGRPEAHLSITEIGAVLDVLRNEKPLSIMWDDQRKLVWLATGQEPVGEAEYD